MKATRKIPPVRIPVLLTPAEAERFEGYCQEHGYKKSTLIGRLIREHLDREGYPGQQVLFGDLPRSGKPRT